VGARFANTAPAMLLDYFWAGLGSAAVAIAGSSVFVLLVVDFLPFPASHVGIAFSPGAPDTMMVVALAPRPPPGFFRAPPPYALPDRDLHGCARRASPGAPSCSAAGRAAAATDIR